MVDATSLSFAEPQGGQMRRRLMAWMILAAFVATTSLPAAVAAQQQNPNQNRTVLPISGTVNGVAGTLTGTFAITRFATQNGALVAVGTLTATVTDATGNILRTIIQQIAVPVAAINGTCQILHLELGPLDLNLLGLLVHLDQVVLDITAQSGAGNLLGNLLCGIASLLDGGGLLSQLSTLLNQLLGALAGL
jgi:hypothetical protein